MKKLALCAALVLGTMAGSARAQLVIAVDDATLAEAAWLIDVNNGVASPLWSGVEAWGLAVDDPNGIIYTSDGTTLQSWTYNQATPPTALGTVTDAVGGGSLSMVGLAFANGELYCYTASVTEGFWKIDVNTLTATLVLGVAGADFDFGGIDYNPADGLFYGTNDDSTPQRGLFSIDVLGTGAITFITDYPAGETDIDGCAVGNNQVFLIEDEPAPIHTWDLATGTYLANPVNNPITTSEVFSGGGWAPSLFVAQPPFNYCTGKTNSLGCDAVVTAAGVASATDTSGFTVTATNIRNFKSGLLLYGTTGADARPFQGGLLCMMAPFRRGPAVFSGGSWLPANDCTGIYTTDMNTFARGLLGGSPAPELSVVGTTVNCQWWGRDKGDPWNSSLTSAIQYQVAP